MAAEGGGSENLTTIGQIAAGIVVGAFWIAAWVKRWAAGRKEAAPVPSMSFEQAFSTPTDHLHKEAERCAEALEEIRDLIKTLLSEQEKAKEAEKAAAIQHRLDAAEQDRRDLMAMIESLKSDIARQDRRGAKVQHP